MNNAQGIDISFYDGGPGDDLQELDFSQYAIKYPIVDVKVSEGTVQDPLFWRNWRRARGRVIRQGYTFFRSFVNQKLAVQAMLEYMRGDLGELPPALDLEAADGSTEVMSLAHVWLDELERLTGLLGWVYSGDGFLDDNGAGYQTKWERLIGTYHNAWLKRHPLWLGQYPFDKLEEMPGYAEHGDALRAILIREVLDGKRLLAWPKAHAPWDKVRMWQWTSRLQPSEVPGYYMGPNHKDAVDLNFHELESIDLKALYPLPPIGEPDPPGPPPPEGDHMYKCKVTWPTGANIRPAPNTNNTAEQYYYPQGAEFYALALVPDSANPADTTRRWAMIASDPLNGEKYAGKAVAVTYGTVRCTTELMAGPPPPGPAAFLTHVDLQDTATGRKYAGDVELKEQP